MSTERFGEHASLLARQIAKLHHGPGMTGELSGRLGPELLMALGPVPPDRDLGAHLRVTMNHGSSGLSERPRIAFLFASGLSHRGAFLEDRLKAAGQLLDRDPRSVRRYLEAANAGVAAFLLDQAARPHHDAAPQRWVVTDMAARLDLRGRRPTFTATKTIYVTAPIDRIVDSVNLLAVPGEPLPEIDVEILTGGTLDSVVHASRTAWTITTRLPRTLGTGSTHRYIQRVSVPSARMFRPLNVILPLRPVNSFTSAIDFPDDRLPRLIRRLDGYVPAILQEDLTEAVGQPVPPEASVSNTFTSPVTGMVYGLWWEPSD